MTYSVAPFYQLQEFGVIRCIEQIMNQLIVYGREERLNG
jgi:hypothetical protein